MPRSAYKRCKDCGEEKPITDFHIGDRMKDGRRGTCKACENARLQAWRRANPRKTIEHRRRYNQQHPDELVARSRRYDKRHPEKLKAHVAVANAVRRGKLIKPDSCEDCGGTASKVDLHAHHHDYSKPLEVRWLCRWCHLAEHGQIEQRPSNLATGA